MSISAIVSVAAKEVVSHAASEVATQSVREVAQEMAAEGGSQGAQGAANEFQTAMMERQSMQEGFRVGEMPENKGEGREILKQRESDAAEELRGKLDDGEPLPEAWTIDGKGDEDEFSVTLEQVEGKDAFRETIKGETGWSDDIVDNIRNEGEFNVYKNADLQEGSLNGKQHLQQREIDLSYKDDFGRTNAERMEQGLSAYDAKSGEKLELHHMGQKADSPFAELRENSDHGDGNHHTLHDLKSESWRHESGRVSEYASQRAEYWKARLEQLLA